MNILVVDDEKEICRACGNLLKNENYKVDVMLYRDTGSAEYTDTFLRSGHIGCHASGLWMALAFVGPFVRTTHGPLSC